MPRRRFLHRLQARCRDRLSADPPNKLACKRAWAAAHVQHTLARADSAELGQLGCELRRVSTHEPVIGFSDLEGHRAHPTPVQIGKRRCLRPEYSGPFPHCSPIGCLRQRRAGRHGAGDPRIAAEPAAPRRDREAPRSPLGTQARHCSTSDGAGRGRGASGGQDAARAGHRDRATTASASTSDWAGTRSA